jgi:dimethylamine/trimethylamine dehydrogenase
LPKKIEEGRYDDIRECIGCNICAARFPQISPIICTQNATAGEEYRRGWHPERFTEAANHDRDVLIVGAGPAGLECAVVLAKRGMRRVHLVDEQDDVGGCLHRITAYPHLGEWARVVQYRKIQLERLRNVDVILSTSLSPEDTLSYGAEVVIVATGARWRRDGVHGSPQTPIPGAESEFVFTPNEVSDADGAIAGDRVLVFDADGYFTAIGMAELLMRRGKAVTIVTPFPNLAPYMFFTGEGFRVNRELRASGVEIVPNHVVTSIEQNHLRGRNVWAAQDEVEWNADSVVLVTQREPRDELYRALIAAGERLPGEGIDAVYRIGDCVAPRLIADCVFDGHRLGREIDSVDPAVPSSFVREYRTPTLAMR